MSTNRLDPRWRKPRYRPSAPDPLQAILDPVHVNTLYNCLRRVVDRDYRTVIATAAGAMSPPPAGPAWP